MEEIKELTGLDPLKERKAIREITQKCLDKIELQIQNLQEVADTLRPLLHQCERSNRKNLCPIIKALHQ